ncbi:YGL143Cp-like protein [Nadsonia fulvescens var. elongata DSM 6958]|uniref:Peptide chain release factor 1, mitochondrial n=1 Tax=Nadsonia fulvescens var. elongata DSM 6958 TaxID=857566 RepID=A0A1E3PGR6_9ASCO|nr:YGL143Cp-like protein [Nadsonia fulvescens var. elongata DSM 6958]
MILSQLGRTARNASAKYSISNSYRSFSANRRLYSSETSEIKFLPGLLCKRAEKICDEYNKLEKEASNAQTYNSEVSTKLVKLGSIVNNYREYESSVSEIDDLRQMFSDPSLKAEAEEEMKSLTESIKTLVDKLQSRLLPPHIFSDNACILELRPGVGGSEAMIFTEDLLHMYQGYATENKWPFQVVSLTPNSAGGITEAILSVDKPGSYEKFQYEAGVHRVQRVPATESKGRTHTSTAAVVVLPQLGGDSEADAEASERKYAPGEVHIEVMRARGAGGQHVNRTESAVRITHIPSGIVVSMQDARSQHKNKAKAFQILDSRLAEIERVKRVEFEKSKRTAQVSSTGRSDKIRTYNYVQKRVTDHRCGFSMYNLDECMTGKRLEEVIQAMEKHDQIEKMEMLLEQET